MAQHAVQCTLVLDINHELRPIISPGVHEALPYTRAYTATDHRGLRDYIAAHLPLVSFTVKRVDTDEELGGPHAVINQDLGPLYVQRQSVPCTLLQHGDSLALVRRGDGSMEHALLAARTKWQPEEGGELYIADLQTRPVEVLVRYQPLTLKQTCFRQLDSMQWLHLIHADAVVPETLRDEIMEQCKALRLNAAKHYAGAVQQPRKLDLFLTHTLHDAYDDLKTEAVALVRFALAGEQLQTALYLVGKGFAVPPDCYDRVLDHAYEERSLSVLTVLARQNERWGTYWLRKCVQRCAFEHERVEREDDSDAGAYQDWWG